MKKTTLAGLAAALLLAACAGGASTEQAADKTVDPLWGMWLAMPQPGDSTKIEVMFNEDSTGFFFVNDQVALLSRWVRSDSLISIDWYSANDSVSRRVGQNRVAIVSLGGDTLVAESEGTQYTLLRERE